MPNASHKLKKKYSDGNFVKFSKQFLEEHTKNCTETSTTLKRKMAEQPRRKFGNIWGVLENLSRGALKRSDTAYNNEYTFQNKCLT